MISVHCTKDMLTGLKPASKNREQAIPAFMDWLHQNGVDTSAVEVHAFPGYGYGLRATKDIKVNAHSFKSLAVHAFPGYGYSLRATKDIKVNAQSLEVHAFPGYGYGLRATKTSR